MNKSIAGIIPIHNYKYSLVYPSASIARVQNQEPLVFVKLLRRIIICCFWGQLNAQASCGKFSPFIEGP